MQKITGSLVDFHTKQIYPVCIEISDDGNITRIHKDMSIIALSFPEAKKIPYIMCGFIDSHSTVESSFLSPAEYARVALSQGVIGAVTDFHEIVQILGYKGYELLKQNTKNIPFYFSTGAPSREAEGLYSLSDIEKLLKRPDISHLGELRDFPSVILGDTKELLKISYAQKEHKPCDGCAPGLSAIHIRELYGRGITTDSRCISAMDAEEKAAIGLKVQLALNDAEEGIKDYVPLINRYDDRLMFCSESESCFRMTKGYIRSAVRNAVKQGADIFSVLRCACSNPAEHYGMKSGLLREGDSADFIMVNNLEDFSVLRVYIKGTCIFSNDGPAQLPEPFPQTLQVLNDFCAQPLHADSILVRAQHSIEKVNVISCSDGEACTMHKKIIMNAHGGYIRSEPDIDCLKLVYYSRYSSFAPRTAFVQGFGLKEGALAVSVSHDEHNIIAFGVSDCDIVSAVNRVIALEGGIVFTLNGEVITEAPLSVAGIISNEPAEKVIDKIGKIKTALLLSGCTLERPVTTLSNCALTSVPVLKISEGGLFDVASQEEISLFCSV